MKRRAITMLEGLLVVVILAVLVAIFMPVHTKDDRHDDIWCLSNVKQIGTSALIYGSDWDEYMPPAPEWTASLGSYTKNPHLFNCPELMMMNQKFGYAINDKAAGIKPSLLEHPEKRVAFFETNDLRDSAHGPISTVALPGRHHGRSSVSFLDGHVKFLQEDQRLE